MLLIKGEAGTSYSNGSPMIADVFSTSGTTHVRPTAPVRMLLIEDNHSDVFLISRMLHEDCEEGAFDIVDTPRLAEALTLLDHQNFDIILLDLTLLDMDGVASVAALSAEAPTTPIIVYSGLHNPSLRHEALMCGAKHYLIKGRESPYSLRFIIQQTLDSCS